MNRSLDLGCGPNKKPGSYGVDCFAFPGVDQVFEFEGSDWPLENERFDQVHCSHVIEHIQNTKHFLKQIHRICRHNATIYIETPHYSWIDSWSDPTHVHHLSTQWCHPFLKGEYLSHLVGDFELIKSELEFSRSVRSWMPRLLVALFGVTTYERYYAFVFPARNVKTWLRVVKN